MTKKLMGDPMRRRMPVCDWPHPDRAAWDRATTVRRIKSGAAAKWRPDTREKVAKAYGRWLSFLRCHEWLDASALPAMRVDEGRVDAYVSLLRDQVAPLTVCGLVLDLAEALRVMAPPRLKWLYDLHHELSLDAWPVRDKRQKIRDPRELAALGMRLMAEASTRRFRERNHWAGLYRDGLMILFLACRPLRRRTLALLRLGQHIVRNEPGYHLALESEDLKTGGTYEADLPSMLTAPLDRYLVEIRPVLMGSSESDWLWISTDGARLGEDTIYGRIRELTRQNLGVAMNPHLFRDCLMTGITSKRPDYVPLGGVMLQHRSPISARHYDLARQIHAADQYQEEIIRLRGLYGAPEADW